MGAAMSTCLPGLPAACQPSRPVQGVEEARDLHLALPKLLCCSGADVSELKAVRPRRAQPGQPFLGGPGPGEGGGAIAAAGAAMAPEAGDSSGAAVAAAEDGPGAAAEVCLQAEASSDDSADSTDEASEDWRGFSDLPGEVHALLSLQHLGMPQPVARLACVSRELRIRLSDPRGCLRISSISASRLACATGGLQRVRFQCLVALRVDLLSESAKLLRKDVEGFVAYLGDCLSRGLVLSTLAIRLASFDASMERLRLGRQAWEALVRGLQALARHRRLRSLELSFVALKLAQATQAVAPAAEANDEAREEPLTFLKALGSISSLEELALTHADLFGATALELARALQELPLLKRVDLTRNRISKQVMREFRAAMPPQVQICGSDLQTICCEELPSGLPSSSRR